MQEKIPPTDHLLNLYLNWKKSPSQFNEEMAETVDKIIFSTLSRQRLNPIYKRIEDHEDLIQDLRILCFQKLTKISNPTNKRIFNYLKISINLALRDKARKVGKFLDRESKEAEILGDRKKSTPPMLFYNNSLLENIAKLLAEGETKQNICSILSITRTKLNKEIQKLRTIYNEEK